MWQLNGDGSGTWTRRDRGATRYSSLYSSGPARQEVHTRETYDANTGDLIGTTKNFDTAKLLNQELPDPVPRDIKSVFYFNSTAKKVPARGEGEVAAAAWRPSLRNTVGLC